MLEESRMDKKSVNRSSQPQSRASAIDCKKSTDLTHKPWPRNVKKREGSGTAPKNEPYRKNGPTQRGKGQFDKRPRMRVGPTNIDMGGAQNTGIENDDEPEIGSVFVPGSKKQNMNHLLNFMYPSRGTQDRGPEWRRAPAARRQGLQRAYHRLDQDLYLRANCQFVVKEGEDNKANLLDPDVPVKWEQIEEIVIRSTGRPECPICLGAPAAGRVGHCGHVYCWPCALHHASVHERQPPPCPVCAAPLHVPDMKPTKIVQWAAPDDQVTMRLVRRLRGFTTVEIAPPRGQLCDGEATPMQPLENVDRAPYCKFFTATKQQVRDILERERKEIKDQMMAEIDTTEIVFMEDALKMLQHKEDTINTQYDLPKLVEEKCDAVPIVYEKQRVDQPKHDWFNVTEDGDAVVETVQEQIRDLAIATNQTSLNPEAPVFELCESSDNQPEEFPLIDNPIHDTNTQDEITSDVDKQNQAKYFYFYQAEDGQQVFLNSLNVRILNASWGVLAAAPSIIKGRVLHRETIPLEELTRKRMPYTAHLPLYCSIDIVELDLQPPYVTEDALMSFSDELDRRARMRARQEREERKRERAYRRAQEGPPKPDFLSPDLFPLAMPSHASPPVHVIPIVPPIVDVSPSTSATSPPGLSFAKMAGSGGQWRVRKPAAALSPPPPPEEGEDEGSAPRALCLNDAFVAAKHTQRPSSGKKNKKSKQKVLFSNALHHTS